MTERTVQVFTSLEDLYQAAAVHIAEVITQAARSRGKAYVALSGGSTPLSLYQLLAQPPYQTVIPWDAVHFYWGDERCVPPDHPESNYGQVKQALLDHIPAQEERIHRIKGELEPADAASNYIRTLAESGDSANPWPRMDITLLGMGADGHTASLFPGSINSGEKRLPVIAVTAHYLGRPANRVTLTPLFFNSSRNIIFLVTGQNKAQVLSTVLDGPQNPVNFPVQRIQPADGKIIWIIDSTAAKFL
jgi:6-phosphogluconolactonase